MRAATLCAAVAAVAHVATVAGALIADFSSAASLVRGTGGSPPVFPDYYAGDGTLNRVQIDTNTYPDAVCNDGSPAQFYYTAGSSDVWLVYLQGGFWCWGMKSCYGRQANEPFEMSSNGWPNTMVAGGIFSRVSSQNPFATAHIAYVGYCSSDAWMGAAPASDATFGFAFQGQAIISAAVDTLVSQYGMGGGDRMLLAGCSAGARGVMANVDNVASQLSAHGVTVSALIDSGIWMDIQPPVEATDQGGSGTPLQTQTALIMQFINPSNVIPAACSAQYEGEEWKCLFGQYRMPFLQTPYFANQAQFDSFQLEFDLGGNVPKYPPAQDFAGQFQQAALQVMKGLPTASQPRSGVFSSVCFLHCTTDGPEFWTVTADGKSLESSVAEWFFQGTAPLQVIDESCSGWSCHAQCLPDELPAVDGGDGGTVAIKAAPNALAPSYALAPSAEGGQANGGHEWQDFFSGSGGGGQSSGEGSSGQGSGQVSQTEPSLTSAQHESLMSWIDTGKASPPGPGEQSFTPDSANNAQASARRLLRL